MAKNSISKISNAFSTGGGGVNFERIPSNMSTGVDLYLKLTQF